MLELFNTFDNRLLEAGLIEFVLRHFVITILIAARFMGVFSIGPVFGHSVVPKKVRILTALGLAFILAPLMHQRADQFDTNQDGFLQQAELPDHLHERWHRFVSEQQQDQQLRLNDLSTSKVPIAAWRSQATVPRTSLRLAVLLLGEFAVGFVLGLGVLAFLSGLQLGGQMIDRQLGIAFGTVINPDSKSSSVSGQLLFMFGTLVFLTMTPINGHVLLVEGLVETFDALPVGDVAFSKNIVDVFGELIHKSLILAVQVAAPVLATMSLLSLAIGFLSRSSPSFNTVGLGLPLRALVGVFVLTMSLSGIARQIAESVPQIFLELRDAISHV
jgi:flagellar biosynthesis protein FliR